MSAPDSIQHSVAKRQAEFLAGRICAREALRFFHSRPAPPTLNSDRSPGWPVGITGSITHGTAWAAAVAASTSTWRSLGLDAERILGAESAQSLATEILTAGEQQRLRRDDQGMQVTLTFSFKESLYKALYPLVKRPFYFEAAELLDYTPGGSARLRLCFSLSEEWSAGTVLQGRFCIYREHLLTLVAVPWT